MLLDGGHRGDDRKNYLPSPIDFQLSSALSRESCPPNVGYIF